MAEGKTMDQATDASIYPDKPVKTVRKRGWQRALALVAIAGGVALAAALLVPPGGAHATCSDKGAVVIVPGTNDPTGEGSMKGIIENAKHDGKDVIVVGYPTTLWPAGSIGFDKDVEMGKAATAAAISDYQAKCGVVDPSADGDDKTGHVQVVGYSQGARVAGDVLADIGQGKAGAPSPVGVTGVLYSDPRQEGPESGRGIEQSFLGVIPGLSMSGSRGGFGVLSNSVVSICSEGDPICDLPDLIHDPLGALDGLIGYFVKHGDYPILGAWGYDQGEWYWEDPVKWVGGESNCSTASNGGGLICIKPQDSSIARVVRDVAMSLGMSATDAAKIPDFFGQINRVLNINSILPHANLNDLQPVVDLVYSALPQLPYLSYNAGGYLPDALVFGQLIGGIAEVIQGGSGSMLRDSASRIGLSVASILLIPVNGVLYWGNKLLGTPHPAAIRNLGFLPDETKDWSLPPIWANGGPTSQVVTSGEATALAEAGDASRAAFNTRVQAAEKSPVWTAVANVDTAKTGAVDKRAARLARWKDAKPGFTPTTPDTAASHQATKHARLPGLQPNKPAPDPAAQAGRQRPQFTRPFTTPRTEQTQPQNTQPQNTQPQDTQRQYTQPQYTQPAPADQAPPQQAPTPQRKPWTPTWKPGNGDSSSRSGFGNGGTPGNSFGGGSARFGSGATQ